MQCFDQFGIMSLCRDFGLDIVYLRTLAIVLRFNDFYNGYFSFFITFECLAFVFTGLFQGVAGQTDLLHGLCQRGLGGLYFQFYIIRYLFR